MPPRTPAPRPRYQVKRKPTARAQAWSRLLLRRAGYYALLGLLWVGIAGFCYLAYCALTLPDLKAVEALRRRPMILVLAADGQAIAEYGDRAASPISLAQMPPYLPAAVIATEDRRFYQHHGVDPFGLLRALGANILRGHTVQGGSTLTQQLAKNLFLSPERTLRRKVQEAMLALWLERTYTKPQILEAYLNRVYFGGGAYGVEAASQTYFGKPVAEINLREAALLAGLLKAPSRYSPRADLQAATDRTEVVLGAMRDAGALSEADERKLKRTPPLSKARTSAGGVGRYFADWVVGQAQDIVGDAQADLIIQTTLVRGVQAQAEAAVTRHLDQDGPGSQVSQGAAVLLGHDGAVEAFVGGRDYGDSQYDRAVQALRQPGSAFKPFVYLAGLESGLTPGTIMDDSPHSFGGYAPENYDQKFRGDISLRAALAESVNVVAVEVLQQAGVGHVRRLAKKLGITSALPNNLSLALGTGVVTPYELAGAYAALAAGGQAVAPYAITEIKTLGTDGEVLYRHRPVPLPQVAAAHDVAQLTGMMEGVIGWGTGRAAALDGRPVAGKTGTSSDYRDAWFAGFTHDHTLVVWVGNDDNSPMKKVTGGGLPARLWHDIMLAAEANVPAQPLLSAGEDAPDVPEAGATPAEGGAPDEAAPAAEHSGGENDGILGGVFGRLFGGGDSGPGGDHQAPERPAYPSGKN